MKFLLLIGVLLTVFSQSGWAQDSQALETTPTVLKGSQVFKKRCSLCHGSVGMGEGLLALSIKDYPQTNLLEAQNATSDEDIRSVIIWGAKNGKSSQYSPPWGNELTWTEIESLVLFVKHLRTDTEDAIALLNKLKLKSNPTLKEGSKIYQSRCARCHGKTGLGDGKMAKIIKNPPPYNLTQSIMPPQYLRAIITKGGEAMRRSPKMPPFGEELSSKELESVLMYLTKLRDNVSF